MADPNNETTTVPHDANGAKEEGSEEVQVEESALGDFKEESGEKDATVPSTADGPPPETPPDSSLDANEKCEANAEVENDAKDAPDANGSKIKEETNEVQDVKMTDAAEDEAAAKDKEEASTDVAKEETTEEDAKMTDIQVESAASETKTNEEAPVVMEEEEIKEENRSSKSNKDHNIGKTFERFKMLPSGHAYPLQGKVVAYQEPSGRFPPRWSVHWGTTENVILEDEWVAADLAPVDETTASNNIGNTLALNNVQARYQQHVEHALESNNLVSTLLLIAAMEEVLQMSLHQRKDNSSTTNVKGGRQSPHPPLYYSSNPSSYLQPPTATDTTPSLSTTKLQITPSNLAQRVRIGCQWAWNYLAAQQPPAPLPPLAATQRRSLRQPKAHVGPTVPTPTPVQRGGRVAMWWLEELGKGDTKKLAKEAKQVKKEEPEVADTEDENTNMEETAPKKEESADPNGNEKPDTIVEEAESMPEEDEESEGSAAKNDDEDFSAKDAEDDDDDDEDLEDVEKERKGNLSPVPEPTNSSDEEEEKEEEEEDEDDENDILYENPYLKPSFPAFLEYLARPKALSGEDVQTALCDSVLRIKHNKRSANHGLVTSTLHSVDQVVLDQETPDYPPGKVVLNCVSGEAYAELQKLDPQVFSRCKFSLDVIGEQETSQQVQRKQELLLQEAEFKERKAWDKWRYRGIHEGYASWPSWHDAISEWVQANCTTETTPAESEQQVVEEAKDDEALAKTLEESETSGRRRTTRRAAAPGASDGVFYGNQSQLTQKQLMDALIRLVKANKFQTMIRLQGMVADDSSDPIRRSRIALGKLVWKQNQLIRKSVTADLSDAKLTKLLTEKPLVSIQHPEIDDNTGDIEADTESKELSSEEKDIVKYIQELHLTELKLRGVVLKHLAEIPVAIIATAADERQGSMESMDAADFEDPSAIEWHTTGHDLINAIIYRPADFKATTDMSECHWYKIQDYSKSISSEGGDGVDDPLSMERRMRFRAVPAPAPAASTVEPGETLILTEAQVHAGIKGADLGNQQSKGNSSSGNPFAGGSGDRITLIPVDMDEMDESQETPSEIHCRIIGHDNVIVEDDDEVEYRILVLPESTSTEQKEAFWATLDVRADDSSYVCQPLGESTTWYSIEHFDYHQSSAAYNECQKIVNQLSRQAKAGPFMQPVDPVALKIPTYFTIIKNPMDISTLADKLENGHYSSIPPSQTVGYTPVSRMLNGPFRKDVELIFDNSMLFNPPDDWIYQAAAQLKKNVLKKIADASYAADQKLSSSGRFRQKRSVYVDGDSDVDMYEYESDQDDDFETGGRQKRKRKRASRGGGANKDDFAARAIEHTIRLQATLRDGMDLRGPFSNIPISTDASSFSLSEEWSCRKSTAVQEASKEDDKDSTSQKRAQEMAELLALQRVVEENEAAGLRRSTRAHDDPDTSSSSKSKKDAVEFFAKDKDNEVQDEILVSPTSRLEVELQKEKRHEEYYSKLYQAYTTSMMSAQEEHGSFGLYANGSFPPYLGKVVPIAGLNEVSWQIRAPFVVPALRWVLRGLIQSGHLTAVENMSTDLSSGVIMTNDIYYWDAKLQPFEFLDLKELQRRKRANKPDGEDSEEDIELSEYEKLRAERVARNAERLKALGLA